MNRTVIGLPIVSHHLIFFIYHNQYHLKILINFYKYTPTKIYNSIKQYHKRAFKEKDYEYYQVSWRQWDNRLALCCHVTADTLRTWVGEDKKKALTGSVSSGYGLGPVSGLSDPSLNLTMVKILNPTTFYKSPCSLAMLTEHSLRFALLSLLFEIHGHGAAVALADASGDASAGGWGFWMVWERESLGFEVHSLLLLEFRWIFLF